MAEKILETLDFLSHLGSLQACVVIYTASASDTDGVQSV